MSKHYCFKRWWYDPQAAVSKSHEQQNISCGEICLDIVVFSNNIDCSLLKKPQHCNLFTHLLCLPTEPTYLIYFYGLVVSNLIVVVFIQIRLFCSMISELFCKDSFVISLMDLFGLAGTLALAQNPLSFGLFFKVKSSSQ